MHGKCQAKNLIYKCDVISRDEKVVETSKNYDGQSMCFKDRFNKHSSALKHENSSAATSLSKYVWKLKHEGYEYQEPPPKAWNKAIKSFSLKWSITLHYQIGVMHRIKVTVDKSPKINKTNSFNSN